MWRRWTRGAATVPGPARTRWGLPVGGRSSHRRGRASGRAPERCLPLPAGDLTGAPADPAAALKGLAALASRTAGAHTEALAGAPAELARLLASVAAASAAHAYLLATPAGEPVVSELEAAQAALSAEHAAVYGYGVVGARLDGDRRAEAAAAHAAHRARRDALDRTVRDLGGTPAAAPPRTPCRSRWWTRTGRCGSPPSWRTGWRACTPISYGPPAARCAGTRRAPCGRRPCGRCAGAAAA